MDLDRVVRQMRLDVLALQVSRALAAQEVPHALLKGPTTACWLYDPPREYKDVDILVPKDRLLRAVAALEVAGVAAATGGALGEMTDHSVLLVTPAGAEIDLHVQFSLMESRQADRVWGVVASHVVEVDVADGRMPALDVPARCVVLALHALGSRSTASQAAEDLRRAHRTATSEEWGAAQALAGELLVEPLFLSGTALALGRPQPPGLPLELRLWLAGSVTGFKIVRVLRLPVREQAAQVRAELLPSREFMSRYDRTYGRGEVSLARAHARRWRHLAGKLLR